MLLLLLLAPPPRMKQLRLRFRIQSGQLLHGAFTALASHAVDVISHGQQDMKGTRVRRHAFADKSLRRRMHSLIALVSLLRNVLRVAWALPIIVGMDVITFHLVEGAAIVGGTFATCVSISSH